MSHFLAVYRRAGLLAAFLFTIFFIAACAHGTGATGINDAKNQLWAGRISLHIESEPPQAFFAGFELKGQAEQGELTLTSPIGSVLGVMRWSPAEATLETGGQVRQYASVDMLLEQSTGAAVPVSALFDWLKGQNTSLNGWTADLSQQNTGRIDAVRLAPLPQTKLRIVLDK